ncbi:MAG: helix-turn-helix domain-containing protein [Myxococcota bacterium]
MPKGLTPEQRQELGRRLREAREAQGITIADAARSVGAQWHTLKRYENGEISPSARRLVQLADLYGTRESELLPPGAQAEETQLEREGDAYSAFLDFLESPLGLELQAGEMLGEAEDRAILEDLRRIRFGGIEPSVHVYTTMAHDEIARRRGRAVREPEPVQTKPRSNRKPLKPRKKR